MLKFVAFCMQGRNLNIVFTEADFKVLIDGVNCPITAVSISHMTCAIPKLVQEKAEGGANQKVLV